MRLEVRGLAKDHAGQAIFRDLSFSVEEGQILFITGPSGTGKTTLLKCLACLEAHQKGDVFLRGKSASSLPVPQWRAEVTYVLQARVDHPGNPQSSLAKALAFKAQAARQVPRGDLLSLAESLGLSKQLLERDWVQLSGGEAQRAALAIALALNPQVLLLDEPTSSCDEASAKKIEAAVAGFARSSRCAVVWVTHNPEQPGRVGGEILRLTPLHGASSAV